ncbi:NifU family protein [Actinophytocola sp.]|uniref:NifU family protein n=1 Tax=Actinophytocola sp. TaxID=1872138 RepID=UPI002D80693D|nr:NifU family protein [Actinophytocola sp.]HET9143520.1 NifU family protein [Actinophytocola sp.]
MAANARDVGDRIEQLLAGLTSGRDKESAEELVRLLVDMYGEGLTRVVALLAERDPALVHLLAEDELVESLLLLHDLHPLDVDTRIQQALDRVRPYLGSHAGGVEYLGVDDNGVAQLRLQGNCNGCPSSTLTVRTAIEGAISDAAPELEGVEVAGVTEEPLLQVGMGPPPDWRGGDRTGWTALPEIGPPAGHPVSVVVDGTPVVVCAVRGTLYAYRDSCGACASSLESSTVDDAVLVCGSCAARFDVRLAGRGLDDPARHLHPLPLLSDSQGVRVAVGR